MPLVNKRTQKSTFYFFPVDEFGVCVAAIEKQGVCPAFAMVNLRECGNRTAFYIIAYVIYS